MSLNNVISAVLVVTAVLSGLGLTVRNKEKDERPEVRDFARMTDIPTGLVQKQSRKLRGR